MKTYDEFLADKKLSVKTKKRLKYKGLNKNLFDYQKHVVDFHCGRGGGASFLDTGMGKSLVSLDYQRIAIENYNKPTLMLAPLAVGPQHVRESEKFDVIEAEYTKDPKDHYKSQVYITNYENVHKFDPNDFCAVVPDESSIIKNFTGATTRKLMSQFENTEHKLCLTATPAPNDYMELGQHAQFLDVMSSSEMLARWFIADQSAMGTYRLKKSAIEDYWSWVAGWARCVTKPSGLGFSDDGYNLPNLEIIRHVAKTDIAGFEDGQLLKVPDLSATAMHKEKRRNAKDRAGMVAKISEQCEGVHVVWCDTDYEAKELMQAMPWATEVSGSMKPDMKEERLIAFSNGEIRTLVTKSKIAGFGLNWQHCNETIYAGINHSYESFYQSLRRFYRFGQKKDVKAHVVMAETEEPIWNNLQRKKEQHETMKSQMAEAMKREVIEKGVRNAYEPAKVAKLPSFLN